MSYGFIRDTNTWGVNSIPFDLYTQAGIDNVLFNDHDPHLAQAIENARAHHVKFGIWSDPHSMDATQFAAYINHLATQYRPDIVVPDVEFTGKGDPGSPGWKWSDQFVNRFRQLNPSQRLGLTMMGHQSDFNYGAYLKGGTDVFLPQSYGETYDYKLDPDVVTKVLLSSGVPADKIQAVLAPGQAGHGSYYALDDFTPAQIRGLATARSASPPRPTIAAAAPSTRPDLAAIQAAVRDGVSNPRRYMMQARVNPGARRAVNTVLRRQVVRNHP